jgi:hypothetical protein
MGTSGAFSAGETLSGTTAVTLTLSNRYEFITVANNTGVEIFVRTDGQAATVDGDLCVAIAPETDSVVANMLPLWDQASTVIPAGSNNQWGQWKGGGMANPGVSVSIIAVTTPTEATPTVTIQGAG